jgi:hypothetical protein
MNKTDPLGTYGRGTGWEKKDKEWGEFDRRQKRAASDMEGRASRLEAKGARLDAKNKSGGDTQRAIAASLRTGAAALRSDGSDGHMANAVDQGTYEKDHGTRFGAATVDPDRPLIMTVNIDNKAAWNSGSFNALWSLGHESLHSAGLRDQRGFNGEKAYRFGKELQQKAFHAMTGTRQANINPDHIMDMVY